MTTDPTQSTQDLSEQNLSEIPPLDTQWDSEEKIQTNGDDLVLTIKQLQEQLARSQADYANLVRRSREESSQIGQWTEDKTIIKFLPILDNLERSLEHIPPELTHNPWVEWNKSIVRSMQKVLHDFGVTPMNAVWQEVNPDFHDVISQIPHENTLIQNEVERWYLRWGRALRHAKVIVGDGQQMAS